MTIDEALYNIKQGYRIPYKHDTLTTIIEYLKQAEPCKDCRNCKKWSECECGGVGHKNGTSIGYSIGECKNYEPCENAVSRQAAIEAMYDLCADGKDRVDNPWRDNPNIDAIIDAIENLPSVQAKAKTEWIPIKTRPLTEKEKAEMGTESDYMYDCPLPDDGEEVEITTHLGDVTMDIFCIESGGCYFENYCDDGDVLAWRHKPEPYKVESEIV